MQQNKIFLTLLFVMTLPISTHSAENMLASHDFSQLKQWGVIPNKPAGTGIVNLENRVLTLNRIKAGGDFKLYLVFDKVTNATAYRFICKVKKTGVNNAHIRIIAIHDHDFNVLVRQDIKISNTWKNTELSFTTPAADAKICIQFFPPDEVDGSISLTQFTLLPGTDQTPITQVLQPVITRKHYKPMKTVPSTITLQPYAGKNLLYNGDLSQASFSMPLPLYWKHGYGQDKPECRGLYDYHDGVLRMKTPFSIIQEVDITPEVATAYVLKIRARIPAGSLRCNINLRNLRDQKDKGIGGKSFAATEEWRDMQITFSYTQDDIPGKLIIMLHATGDNGCVELDSITLLPQIPPTRKNAKNVCLEAADCMYPIAGIFLPPHHSYYELKAAKYLRKYLFEASGKSIGLYTQDDGNAPTQPGMIRIGSAFLRTEQKAALQPGGYAIFNKNGVLTISGNTDDDGVIHGVFMILKTIGMEFFTAHAHTMPNDPVICIPTLSLVQNPAIGFRFASGARRTNSNPLGYSDHHLLGSPYRIGRWMASEHTASFLVDPYVYFEKHPEYYAMDKHGKREWPKRGLIDFHLCLSNPEVQRIATENLLHWIKADSWSKYFFVTCGDGHNWCQCENCKKWDPRSSEPRDGFLSDRNIRFVNILAREVAKHYPDKIIATLAYCGCRKAPLRVKPEKNVQVVYCPYPPSWNCWAHMNCPANLRGMQEFAQWVQRFPGQISIFDYPMGGNRPIGQFQAMVRKIRWYANFGIKEISFCGYGSFRPEFNYAMGKLLWNPRTDLEAAIDAFMRFYYGKKAAKPMREYFNMVQEKELARSLHRYDQPASMVDEHFFRTGLALLNRARAFSLAKGIFSIDRQRMCLLQEYLIQHNKTSGLTGTALKEYACNLAELLRLYVTFKVTVPLYRVTVRDLLVRDAQIDIGATKPWYRSPVVQAFWKDPVAMMTKKVRSYTEQTGELVFDVELFSGGENIKRYQYEGLPRTIRPFAKILRRASSPYSKINTNFELPAIPQHNCTLYLEGLDDEKPGKASIQIMINDTVVFAGKNTFGHEDWGIQQITVPATALIRGENTLVIKNITKDKIPLPTFVEAEAPRQDYCWGWVMIANCRLKK